MNNSSIIIRHLAFATGVTLYAQMKESAKLDRVIRESLEGLGYGE